MVGVAVSETYKFPFQVKIRVGDIGGPSAGLMFALGIIDKLTPGNLTGGRFIAGTGEISADGTVSPIGGIQQKMVGARAAGATVFLTPAANCPDTAGAVPQGLRLIKVSTLARCGGVLCRRWRRAAMSRPAEAPAHARSSETEPGMIAVDWRAHGRSVPPQAAEQRADMRGTG